MVALTKYRNTPRMGEGVHPTYLSLPVSDNLKIHNGALVALFFGFAVPASTALGIICVGKAEETADNTKPGHFSGAVSVLVRQGVFKWENSAEADAITFAEVGTYCYAVDDQTVAKTDGGSTRSRAGLVIQVDPDGVWVQVGLSGQV